MDSEVIIAIISGAFAILAAMIACCQQYKINKDSIKNYKRNERNERKIQNIKLLQKYKDPLIQASRELYFSILNIFKIKSQILDSEIKKQTLIYSFAKFFCWKEIIRDNLILIDDIESKQFFNLRHNLINVQNQFENLHVHDEKFKLSSAEQRAIGEIMIENKNCIKYTDFITNYAKYKNWLKVLEDHINQLSLDINNLIPCVPDKKKPLNFYNNLERFCQNLFDPHEWVSKNYFDNPENSKCLKCGEKINLFFHKDNNISIVYFRLLNIKNALNKLISCKDNNKEYYLDIEPIWNQKLEKIIKIKSEKEYYKNKYNYCWKIFYILKYKLYNSESDENFNLEDSPNIENNSESNNSESNNSESNNLETKININLINN